MKVVQFVVTVFSIFTYLTLGSFLTILSLHLVDLDDAMRAVEDLYTNPWRSFQAGMLGLVFVLLGLVFAKFLIKKAQLEGLVYEGPMGRVTVSREAILDITRRVLKKYLLIQDQKVKVLIHGARELELRIRLVVWAGPSIPDFIKQIQDELREKLMKVLGPQSQVDVDVEVQKVLGEAGDPETAASGLAPGARHSL